MSAAVLVSTLALAGCGAADVGGAGRPQVVTSMYPLQYVAERVAGERAEVTNLTSPGAEPHDLELSVAQTGQVADADLVVYLEGLQPAVDEAVRQNPPDHVVEVGEVVDLQPPGGHHEEDPGGHEREHDDEAGDGHGHGEVDPHFWLDPRLLADAATAVRDGLVAADPDHAASYDERLSRLLADLRALDRAFEAGLAECRVDTVVVSHDAFGYLERYGLDFVSVAGLSPDIEPSPRHVAELHRLVREEGVTTVFAETLATPEMAETLASDLDLETAVLDPVEGLGEATADEDYLSLMRANLAALRSASQCT